MLRVFQLTRSHESKCQIVFFLGPLNMIRCVCCVIRWMREVSAATVGLAGWHEPSGEHRSLLAVTQWWNVRMSEGDRDYDDDDDDPFVDIE